jgi:hypothetical protein
LPSTRIDQLVGEASIGPAFARKVPAGALA